MTFKTILSLLGLLVFSVTLPAQTTVKFRTLAWSDPVVDINYDYKGKALPVIAYSHARSDFYQAPAGDPLVFYRLVPGTEGKPPTKEAVAEISLPKNETMMLLLFFKTADGNIRISAAPDDTAKFPPGSYRFVNTCSAQLAVSVGPTPEVLPPLGSIVAKGVPEGPNGGVYVRVAVLGETNALIYSNKWLWSPNSRTLVFIAPTGNPNQPFELKRITENALFKEDTPDNRSPGIH